MCMYTIQRAAPRLAISRMADIDKKYWEQFYEIIALYEHD